MELSPMVQKMFDSLYECTVVAHKDTPEKAPTKEQFYDTMMFAGLDAYKKHIEHQHKKLFKKN